MCSKLSFLGFRRWRGRKAGKSHKERPQLSHSPASLGGGVEMGQGIACQGKDDNDSTLSREGGAAQLRLQEAGGAELTGGAWSGLRRRNV